MRFFEGLARFTRVILFDKRGTGLSDRVTETPMLEQRMDDVRASRYMAERIPGARLVEIDSDDHLPFLEGSEEILAEVEAFLTGGHAPAPADRVVTTIMFTDIVGSTQLAAEMGDARWRDLLEAHHGAVRHELAVYRGREIKSTGDGFHATFDGPARAIQCGCAIRRAVKPMGLSVRVGLHTGECEIKGDSVEGLAVHLAARVAAFAEADQVVVSQTAKDLVAGSGIQFEDLGLQALKGIPDPWRLHGVAAE